VQVAFNSGASKWACEQLANFDDSHLNWFGFVFARQAPACPSNSTLVGGNCVCDSGFEESGSSCVPPSCPTAGTAHPQQGSVVSGTGTSIPNTACHDGCTYTLFNDPGVLLSGTWVSSWGNSTGTLCTAETETPPAGDTSACAAGTCPGTVNGEAVCLPCASHPEATQVKTTASTTTTETTKDAAGDPTGSTETTKTTSTSSVGGKTTTTTTTTTTTKDASGTVTGSVTTETTDETPRDAFCIENPAATICQASAFGGACSGGFSCEGDALQCAIAQELHTRNCTLFDTATTLSTLGEQITTGADPDAALHPAASANREEISLASAIDQSTFISGAPALLADEIIPLPAIVGGGTFALPFSNLNEPLELMGLIVLAFALVAAGRILVGAI
jgi:hypothetical protein